MKRLIFWGLLLGLVAFGIVSCRNWHQAGTARSGLYNEIRQNYQVARVQAAEEAFRLASPYLTEREKGRYEGEIDSVPSSQQVVFFGIDNSAGKLESVIYQLGSAVHQWVREELHKENPTGVPSNQAYAAKMEATPHRAIFTINTDLGLLSSLEYPVAFYNDDALDDLEQITAHRAKFEEAKRCFDALLKNHGKRTEDCTQP